MRLEDTQRMKDAARSPLKGREMLLLSILSPFVLLDLSSIPSVSIYRALITCSRLRDEPRQRHQGERMLGKLSLEMLRAHGSDPESRAQQLSKVER